MADIAQNHRKFHSSDLPLFLWASQRRSASEPKLVLWSVNRWCNVVRVEVR